MRSTIVFAIIGCGTLLIGGCVGGSSSSSGGGGGGGGKPGICRGTHEAIVSTCGCSPRDAAFLLRIDELKFSDDRRAEVEKCAEGKSGATVLQYDLFKANFEGCLRTKTKLNDAYQNLAVKLIDEASKDVDPVQVQNWNEKCAVPVYENLGKCGKHPCPPPPPSPLTGTWVGELHGVAAAPAVIKGKPLRGGIRLTVGAAGGVEGAYNACAETYPSFVVSGRVTGRLEGEEFAGTYDYAGQSKLPLKGRLALANEAEAGASLSAPTAVGQTQLVDTFAIALKKDAPSASIPDPCKELAAASSGRP
jgi:hypothetical protein